MPSERSKDRAKAIIVEIIRQAGGTFQNKTNLFKVFWLAHVKYARSHVSHLSDWPIVKLPNGPGIDAFDSLLGELMEAGIVETVDVESGKFVGFHLHLKDHDAFRDVLSKDASSAIRSAVDGFEGVSVTAVSRAWKLARVGDEIDVALDTMSDEEYEQASERIDRLSDGLQTVLQVSTDTRSVPN